MRPRGSCVAPADPDGGVGAKPPHKENPRVGGWARAAQRARPGWGCGGRSPPQDTRARPIVPPSPLAPPSKATAHAGPRQQRPTPQHPPPAQRRRTPARLDPRRPHPPRTPAPHRRRPRVHQLLHPHQPLLPLARQPPQRPVPPQPRRHPERRLDPPARTPPPRTRRADDRPRAARRGLLQRLPRQVAPLPQPVPGPRSPRLQRLDWATTSPSGASPAPACTRTR